MEIYTRKMKDNKLHRFLNKRNSRPLGPRQGIEMFNALMEQKSSAHQLLIVRNRIEKLENEERKARNQMEKSRKRVKDLELLHVNIIINNS